MLTCCRDILPWNQGSAWGIELWRIESPTPLRGEAGGSAGTGAGTGAAAAAGAELPACNKLPNGSEDTHGPHSQSQTWHKNDNFKQLFLRLHLV